MDKALKQRLVGASVLIALAVIVLPMLLGGRPENGGQESQKIELPPQPSELDFETRRYPIALKPGTDVTVDPAQQRKEPPPQLPLPRASAAEELKAGAGPVPDAAEAQGGNSTADVNGAEQAGHPVEPVRDAVAASGRYVVQVGSFAAMDNANRVSAALRDQGYDVVTDSVKSLTGTLHRVRLGPYSSRAEADRVLMKLQSGVSGVENPRILDLEPDAVDGTAGQQTTADTLARWVVQAGSFSRPSNAESLVAKLRLQGLSAYQESVHSASGSEIFRVRVGPYLERDEASRVKRRLKEQMSLDGVVMSAE